MRLLWNFKEGRSLIHQSIKENYSLRQTASLLVRLLFQKLVHYCFVQCVIYRAVLWPAAWAVSNYLLSEPDLRDNLSSLSILELGTGTGLVSIATAMGGAKRVLATDYEPLALKLTRYAAEKIKNNGDSTNNLSLSERIETRLLDLCALKEQPLPLKSEDGASDFDIVVAADIMVCTFAPVFPPQNNI